MIFICGCNFQLRAASETPPWGKRVLRIEFPTAGNANTSNFAGKVTQKTGEPLDAKQVAQSLKNLYATGRFRSLEAKVKEVNGGVDLIFTGELTSFIGTVTVTESPRAVPPATLSSSARLNLGQPLSKDVLDAAVQRIKKLLADDAYYRAQVHYSVQRNHTNQIANVAFSIDPGKPAELQKVQFNVNAGVPTTRLRKIAGWHRRMHLTSAKIQHGLYLIHRFYTKAGHLEATSNVEKRTYDPTHNTEALAVKIVPGPVVKVHVEGARISSSNLKKILPVYREGLTDSLSLDDGRQKLVNYFEQKGYFSAKARWRRIAHPNEVDITYIVDLGRQAAFEGFDFHGNRSIPSSELGPLVTLQPEGFLTHMHGTFSQEMADQSATAVANYYHSKGFLQAQVHPVLGRKEGELFVTFNVREGAETRVGKLTFKGVSSETAGQLRPLLQAAPGHPYSPALVGKDRNTILTYFANHGHESAAVVPHVSPPDLHEVNVEYEITPGRQLKIQRVAILGNKYTRTGVVQRQLSLQPGQPLSQEKMYDSQRRLYDLGLFNSVQIAPQNPAGAETEKTLLVNVEEARRWTLGYGFGLDVQRLGTGSPQGQFGVSPRLSLDVTRINVGGRDQTFSLRSRVSDLETGGEASYLFPHFLNHPDLTLHIDGTADRTRDVLTFTSFIRQASLSIEKQYSPSTFLVGRYNYRFVTASNLKIQPEEIPLFTQPVRDAGFESTLVHDTRDDPTDATRGSYSLADASISAAKLGSQTDFVRFFGQNATYYRLSSHLVFARNTEFGTETTYGASRRVTVSNGMPSIFTTNQLPLADRFFAGGADSLRAFSLNQAGPRDPVTGYPVGGNAVFVNQFELRVRLRDGRYGIVLFNDAGNVYSSLAEMRLLKFTQTSPADLNYTVQAVGIGLRYKTPIGPVRLDAAYDFNPPRYQFQPSGTSPLERQRLPRFQYFISIGQSF